MSRKKESKKTKKTTAKEPKELKTEASVEKKHETDLKGPALRSPQKSEPKPEPKPVQKSEPKPEPKPVQKSEPKPEPKPVQKSEPKPEPKPVLLTLEEVSRQHVKHYKPHWQASIDSYAKNQGFSDPATKEECLNLLKKWGADLI